MSASEAPLLENKCNNHIVTTAAKPESRYLLKLNFKLYHMILVLIIFAILFTGEKAEMENAFEEIEESSQSFEAAVRQIANAFMILADRFLSNQWNLLLILGCLVSMIVFDFISLHITIVWNEIRLGYKIAPTIIPRHADLTDLDV